MNQAKKDLIEQLKPLTRAIVDLLGPNCEALIHDVSDLEHSIVWVEGDVTHRKIGGPITDVGLAQLRQTPLEEAYTYISNTADGRVLKSTSVLFSDPNGTLLASLCINLDITALRNAEHALHSITQYGGEEQYSEHFSDDINEILDSILFECEREIGKAASAMNKEEKVALVQKMDERGAFQIKRAAPLIAKRLGVTRYTVYNYLNEARSQEENNYPDTRDEID